MHKSHSYIVIGIFPTEISTVGVPLAVLWKVFDPSKGAQLELLLVEDLNQQTVLLELEQRQWVKELIHSIHNVASNDPKRADELFERLSNLNVGPIRTMVLGRSSFCEMTGHLKSFAAVLQRLESN